jgi:hypothetical protein
VFPGKAKGCQGAVEALRMMGRDCVQKQINAIENGEDLPNSILAHLLKSPGEFCMAWHPMRWEVGRWIRNIHVEELGIQIES